MSFDTDTFIEFLHEFMREERDILVNDLNEQTLSHRLAILLESHFTDWDIDCEYNRNKDIVKRLIYAIEPQGIAKERNVVPDIIIHKRMSDNNLLAIEIKKSTNNRDNFKDLAKLTAFKEQLHYQHAVFVRFVTGTQEPDISELTWL